MGIGSSTMSEEDRKSMTDMMDEKVKTLEQTVQTLKTDAMAREKSLRNELMTEIHTQIAALKPNPANDAAVQALEKMVTNLAEDVSKGNATVRRLESTVADAMKQIAGVKITDAAHGRQLQDTTEKLQRQSAAIRQEGAKQDLLEQELQAVQGAVVENSIKTAVNAQGVDKASQQTQTNKAELKELKELKKMKADKKSEGGTPKDKKETPSSTNLSSPALNPTLTDVQAGAGRLALSLLHAGLLQPVRSDVGTLSTTAGPANPYMVRVV